MAEAERLNRISEAESRFNRMTEAENRMNRFNEEVVNRMHRMNDETMSRTMTSDVLNRPIPSLQRQLSNDMGMGLRCDRCHFSFYTKEQLENHKCMPTPAHWTPPSSRPPSLETSTRPPNLDVRENVYSHPMHINLPTFKDHSNYPNYFQSYLQNNYIYPSPPMDPLKHYPTAPHRGTPIAIKQF